MLSGNTFGVLGVRCSSTYDREMTYIIAFIKHFPNTSEDHLNSSEDFEYHLNTLEDFRMVPMISEEFRRSSNYSYYFLPLLEGLLKRLEMSEDII